MLCAIRARTPREPKGNDLQRVDLPDEVLRADGVKAMKTSKDDANTADERDVEHHNSPAEVKRNLANEHRRSEWIVAR